MNEKKWIVKNEMTLNEFLLRYSGINKKLIKQLIGSGNILVNGEVKRQAHWPLVLEDVVELKPMANPSERAPFKILYEDDDILVMDKPAGVLSMANASEKTKTCYHMVGDYLKRKNPKARVYIVHRLDKETSGVLMFAKNEAIKEQLQASWNDIVFERGYLALVEGYFDESKGTLVHYLSENKEMNVYVSDAKTGKKAITHYEVLKQRKGISLIEVHLDTGRKNQIRVQMAHIHHPLIGDRKYNPKGITASHLALHAHRLGFVDPRDGSRRLFESEWPSFLNDFK